MTSRAIAYSPFWRAITAALVVIGRGGLLAMVVAMLFFETRLGNQLRLLRTFVLVSVGPGLAAWLLARAFAALVIVADGVVVVARRGERIEIPCASIARLTPWTLPLPGGGMWLYLRSGRRFRYGLQVADPIALSDALGDAGAADVVREVAHHPMAIYARSRPRPAPWYRPLLAYVVFALVPTIPLFRLHQWVAYGGTFGEYYTYGLQAYVLGFAAHWWTFTIYLVLYAAVLRAVAEAVVLATAYIAPGRVAAVRSIVETVDRVLYFGAVPALLIRLALLT